LRWKPGRSIRVRTPTRAGRGRYEGWPC
jgi:hypothetical protein